MVLSVRLLMGRPIIHYCMSTHGRDHIKAASTIIYFVTGERCLGVPM